MMPPPDIEQIADLDDLIIRLSAVWTNRRDGHAPLDDPGMYMSVFELGQLHLRVGNLGRMRPGVVSVPV